MTELLHYKNRKLRTHRRFLAVAVLALLAAALLYGLSSAGDDAKIDDILSRARSAVDSKSWDLALRYFKAAQKEDPDNPVYIFNTALTLDHLDWHQLDAIVWYQAYLAGAPYAKNAKEVVQRIIDLEKSAYGNAQFLISKAQLAVTGLPAGEQDVGRANIAMAQARVGDLEGIIATARGSLTNDPDMPWSTDGILAFVAVESAKAGNFEHIPGILGVMTNRTHLNTAYSKLSSLYESSGRMNDAWSMALKITDGNLRGQAFAHIAGAMAKNGDRIGSRAAVDEAVSTAANVSSGYERDAIFQKLTESLSSAGVSAVDNFINNISDSEIKKSSRLSVAKNLLDHGDYASAKQLITGLTKEDANRKWADEYNDRMGSLAYTAGKNGDWSRVLLIAEAMFDGQRRARVYTDLAAYYQKEGDRQKALETMRAANKLLHSVLQDSGASSQSTLKSDLRDAVSANLALADMIDPEQRGIIEELLDQALRLFRQLPDLRGEPYLDAHKIVNQFIRLGRIDNALEFLPNIANSPDHQKKETVKKVAEILIEGGSYQKAIQVTEEHASTEKDSVLTAIARRMINDRETGKARDYIMKTRAGNTRNTLFRDLIEALMVDGYYSKALKEISEYAADDQRDELFALVSDDAASAGKPREAAEAIELISDTNKKISAYVKAGRTVYWSRESDAATARKFARKALEASGGKAGRLDLAVLLLSLGEMNSEEDFILSAGDQTAGYLVSRRLDKGDITGALKAVQFIEDPKNKVIALLSTAQKLGVPGDGDVYFREAHDLVSSLNIKVYELSCSDQQFLQYYRCKDFINARAKLLNLEPVPLMPKEEHAEKFARLRESTSTSLYSKSNYAYYAAREFRDLRLGPSAALALAEGNAYASGVTSSSREENVTHIMEVWRDLGFTGEVLSSLGELDSPFIRGIEAARALAELGDRETADKWLRAAEGTLQADSRKSNEHLKTLVLAYVQNGNANAASEVLRKVDFSTEYLANIVSLAQAVQKFGSNEVSHHLWKQAALKSSSVSTLAGDLAKSGELELAIAIQEKMLARPEGPFESSFKSYALSNYVAIAEAQLDLGRGKAALSTISRARDFLVQRVRAGARNLSAIPDLFAVFARAGDSANAGKFLTTPGLHLWRTYYKVAAEMSLAGDPDGAMDTARELHARFSQSSSQMFSVEQELALAIAGAQLDRGENDRAIVTMQPHEKESVYSVFLWRLVDNLQKGGHAARAARVIFDTDDAVLTNMKAFPLIPDLIIQGRLGLALRLSRAITVPHIRDMALMRTMLASYYREGSSALAIADEIGAESRAFGLLSMARMAIRRDDTVTARAALLSAVVPSLQAPSATAQLYLLSSIAGLQSLMSDPLAQNTLTKALAVENDDNPNWRFLRKVWFEGWHSVLREALETEKAKHSLTAQEVRDWISMSDSLNRGDYMQGPTLYTDIPLFLDWVNQHAASEKSALAGLYKLADGAIRIIDKTRDIRDKAQRWKKRHEEELFQNDVK